MAIYPVSWGVECDKCGETARGAPSGDAQEILAAAVQHGWSLLVLPNDTPATVLLCPTCSARAADNGSATADKGGVLATPD